MKGSVGQELSFPRAGRWSYSVSQWGMAMAGPPPSSAQTPVRPCCSGCEVFLPLWLFYLILWSTDKARQRSWKQNLCSPGLTHVRGELWDFARARGRAEVSLQFLQDSVCSHAWGDDRPESTLPSLHTAAVLILLT